MKRLAVLSLAGLFIVAGASFAAAENRCGWLENPTPGNWWLTDSEKSWTIMVQGGYEAQGMDLIGDISAGDYAATNGNYGYACACMKVTTDAANDRIAVIHSVRQLQLAKCQSDKALPEPAR